MTQAEFAALVARLGAAANAGDGEGFVACFSEDGVYHDYIYGPHRGRTAIADMLEKRGLATRESDPGDRRIKRICLTPAGVELRQQVENEILACLPWRNALDADERACLLGLIRKIIPAAGAQSGSASIVTAAQPREEVSEVLVSMPVTGTDT